MISGLPFPHDQGSLLFTVDMTAMPYVPRVSCSGRSALPSQGLTQPSLPSGRGPDDRNARSASRALPYPSGWRTCGPSLRKLPERGVIFNDAVMDRARLFLVVHVRMRRWSRSARHASPIACGAIPICPAGNPPSGCSRVLSKTLIRPTARRTCKRPALSDADPTESYPRYSSRPRPSSRSDCAFFFPT